MASIPSRHAARLACRAPPRAQSSLAPRYFSPASWWKADPPIASGSGAGGVGDGGHGVNDPSVAPEDCAGAAPLGAAPASAGAPASARSSAPSSGAAPSSFTTINPAEIAHFSRLSSQWWDEHGEFGLLHKMNPVRMEFARQKVEQGRGDDRGWDVGMRRRVRRDGGYEAAEMEGCGASRARWLEGMDVLDVGCGGGLLSESLARVGGRTLAIDASPANIAIASLHAAADPFLPFVSDDPAVPSSSLAADEAAGSLRYRHTSAEALEAEGRQFDVVCSMEVVEHVDEPAEFIKSLGNMVKHVLRLVTPGTHTHAKYIKPSELLAFVRDEMGGPAVWSSDGDGLIDGGREGGGLAVGEVRGIVYDPLKGAWRLWPEGVPGGDMCNYLFHLRKRRDVGPAE